MNNRRITSYGFAWFSNRVQVASQSGHYHGPTPPPTVTELRRLRKIQRNR